MLDLMRLDFPGVDHDSLAAPVNVQIFSRTNVRKMFALCPKTSSKRGAASEIRTPDLRITSALLYP